MTLAAQSLTRKLTFDMAAKMLIKGLDFALHLVIIRALRPESYGLQSLVVFMLNFQRFVPYSCLRPTALRRAETFDPSSLLASSQNLVR